jgi:hypothetical protein
VSNAQSVLCVMKFLILKPGNIQVVEILSHLWPAHHVLAEITNDPLLSEVRGAFVDATRPFWTIHHVL